MCVCVNLRIKIRKEKLTKSRISMDTASYNFTLCEFITLPLVDGLSLSDSIFPQVSRTLLGIQADFNTVVVWMVLILPLISSSSSVFNKHLGTVPCTPTTIRITVTLYPSVCLGFFGGWGVISLLRYQNLSVFSLSFIFPLRSSGKAKFIKWQF